MDRTYQNNTNNKVDFFFGKEIEHTPAFGLSTLFVVGIQSIISIQEILDKSPEVEHIYFGANQSFPYMLPDNARWESWVDMIDYFLNKNYYCTLDLDISCVEGLMHRKISMHSSFIPMISAKIPHIQSLNYNATLKIDDIDFQYSNPGVWCHSIHNLKNQNNFTNWSKYSKDIVIDNE